MNAIRLATPSDIPALLEYFSCLGPDTRSRFAPHPFDERTLQNLLKGDSLHIAFIVREDEGPIIAYAIARMYYESYELDRFKGYGWIPNDTTDAFYAPSVADDRQGQGIGKVLMEEALSTLYEKGRTRILLWGGVQASNERALAHYRKAGFQELGGFEWNGWNLDMFHQ